MFESKVLRISVVTEEQNMLVLSRKRGEVIVIGNGIAVTVLAVNGERVKLGVVAPVEVPVHREEIRRHLENGSASRCLSECV